MEVRQLSPHVSLILTASGECPLEVLDTLPRGPHFHILSCGTALHGEDKKLKKETSSDRLFRLLATVSLVVLPLNIWRVRMKEWLVDIVVQSENSFLLFRSKDR